MINLDSFVEDHDDSVTICLFVTQSCNFECRHCMYGEKLTNSATYMSNEILWEVRNQIEILQSLDIPVTVNLIGGEPTLNLNEFERVLDHVARWDVQIEMTTNGWFLRSLELTEKFLKIVRPYIDTQYSEDGLTIRISNDDYHTEQRGFDVKQAFDSIWDDGELFYEKDYYCPDCAEWFDDEDKPDDDICPHCLENNDEEIYLDFDYRDSGFYIDDPRQADDLQWMYIENNDRKYQLGTGVISIGNGQGWGSINHSWDSGCYKNVSTLTYTPEGQLTDICCRGSWLNLGNVYDNPITLILLAEKFKQEMKPHCSTCHSDAEYWKEEEGEEHYKRLQKETIRMFERADL